MYTVHKAMVHRGPKILLLFLVASVTLCCFTSRFSRAEDPPFVIIVNPKLGLHKLERSMVSDAFLKKQTRWANGTPIHPVDLDSQSSVRRDFSHAVLRRSVAAVRNYWQQRIFSGRGVPPPELASERAAVQFVASHSGGIGYVSGKAEIKGVRTISLED